MIVEVRAKFSCDDCGTEFIVPLEPAYKPPAGWSVFDVAEDSIRGGIGYEDGTDELDKLGSVDGIRHLCSRCTRRNDESERSETHDE